MLHSAGTLFSMVTEDSVVKFLVRSAQSAAPGWWIGTSSDVLTGATTTDDPGDPFAEYDTVKLGLLFGHMKFDSYWDDRPVRLDVAKRRTRSRMQYAVRIHKEGSE